MAASVLGHHVRLEYGGGGGHAPCGNEHFGNEGPVCREILAQFVHADDESARENVLSVHAVIKRLVYERQQLFLLTPLDG